MRTPAQCRFCFEAAAIGLAGALALAAPAARANGRYPAANQITVAPSDPQTLLLRTTFGLLASRDAGLRWDWICEQAIGYAGMQDPAIGITATSSVLVGAQEGLLVSPDRGCAWRPVDRNPVIDLVVRDSAPHEALAITSAFSGSRDGGNVFASQVLATTDDAAHWAALGKPIDPTLVLATIDVARSDPLRVYISAHRSASTGTAGVLLVSSDGGVSFIERPIPIDAATETDAFIAAVDPRNADLVYLRTGAETAALTTASRLLVTGDAGKTYSAPFAGGPMLGFALSPDGGKVYLGGPNDGLQVAAKADYVFRQTSIVPVQCLRAIGNVLYVCSDELSSGFTLGQSTNDGSSIAPLLHMADIRGPLACATASSANACIASWPTLENQLGIPSAGTDAGDSSDAAAQPAGKRSTAGCGCHAAGAGAGAGAGASLALLTWLLALRPRMRSWERDDQ